MKKAYLYIALATVIISTMEISGRILSHSLNPTQVNFWRFLVGSIVLMPMSFRHMKKRGIHLNRSDVLFLAAAGFVGMAVSMEMFQVALMTTKASTVAVIVSCVPVGVIPFASIFLKEKFTINTALSLVFSILGILCILNPLHLDPEFKGIVLSIGVVVTFAIYSVMGKAKADRCGGVPFTCFSLLSGALILGVMMIASYLVPAPAAGSALAPFFRIPLFDGIDGGNILALLYFAVVGTGLLYAFLFLAMEETSATIGSVVFFFKPALAPVFAWILLGEQISGRVLAGIVLIVCGTYFVFRPAKNVTDDAVGSYLPIAEDLSEGPK